MAEAIIRIKDAPSDEDPSAIEVAFEVNDWRPTDPQTPALVTASVLGGILINGLPKNAPEPKTLRLVDESEDPDQLRLFDDN